MTPDEQAQAIVADFTHPPGSLHATDETPRLACRIADALQAARTAVEAEREVRTGLGEDEAEKVEEAGAFLERHGEAERSRPAWAHASRLRGLAQAIRARSGGPPVDTDARSVPDRSPQQEEDPDE